MSLLKPCQSPSQVADKLSRMDYYQIMTSILMVILGAIILFRSFAGSITVIPLLVGGGFLALSCYRLKFVVRYFRERRKCIRR
jgi:uncharacterized membrane protein HdeD (DUF308 family)